MELYFVPLKPFPFLISGKKGVETFATTTTAIFNSKTAVSFVPGGTSSSKEPRENRLSR